MVSKILCMAITLLLSILARIAVVSSGHKKTRVFLIRTLLYSTSKILRSLDFYQSITLSPDKNVYVLSDGVLLSTEGTNRYFKIKSKTSNEGVRILQMLKRTNVACHTILDIGANFGEISLYLCKELPHAKIISIEASSDNFKILSQNKSIQKFSTDNVKMLNIAVSDVDGTCKITRGLGSENSIVSNKTNDNKTIAEEHEMIQCHTLSSIIREQSIERIDFIKIDIEGAEPLLIDSLRKCMPHIQVMLIEISSKSDPQKYIELIRVLGAFGHRCLIDNQSFSEISVDEAIREYKSALSKNSSLDLWFINREIEFTA